MGQTSWEIRKQGSTKLLQKKSACGINCLLSTLNEVLGAVKSLGCLTDNWDHLIVYMLVYWLDPETNESWEIHQGAFVTPFSIDKLRLFLESRTRAWENIGCRESQNDPSAKAKAHVAAVSQRKSKRVCPLCQSVDHYLLGCGTFDIKKNYTSVESLHKQLCFNYLGPL